MTTRVRSHAKINLGLYIGAPRKDGFHGLTTVYQTLEAHDVVTVSAHLGEQTSIRLTSNDNRVPCDGRNTAWKMVALALEALEAAAEVSIYIEKRLPIQGGMGAGSANGVAALVGLESELNVEMDPQMRAPLNAFRNMQPENWPERRFEIAAQVGSDVPLFLIGGAVLGTDRGQKVEPLPDFEPVWCVVATPDIGVSTPQAFRDWDALCAREGLTQQASHDKLNELSRAYLSAFAEANQKTGSVPEGRQGAGSSGVPAACGDLAGPQESALVRTGISSWIQNDFERVVFPQHPSLAEIKRILAGSGTPEAACPHSSFLASLSGSGSALFGLYQTRAAAETAQARLRDWSGQVEVRSTLTRTLPRADYWREMLEFEH